MPKGTRGLTDINVCKRFFLFLGEREREREKGERGFLMAQNFITRTTALVYYLMAEKVCIPCAGTNRDHDHHGLISPFLPEQSFSQRRRRFMESRGTASQPSGESQFMEHAGQSMSYMSQMSSGMYYKCMPMSEQSLSRYRFQSEPNRWPKKDQQSFILIHFLLLVDEFPLASLLTGEDTSLNNWRASHADFPGLPGPAASAVGISSLPLSAVADRRLTVFVVCLNRLPGGSLCLTPSNY